jgi:hypothetical protein
MEIREFKNFKVKATFIVFAIALLFLFFAAAFFLYERGYQQCKNYAFNGVVSNVQYDRKGAPTVIINKQAYYLPVNFWNFNKLIERQDIIAKQKGSFSIKLIKFKTGESFEFK